MRYFVTCNIFLNTVVLKKNYIFYEILLLIITKFHFKKNEINYLLNHKKLLNLDKLKLHDKQNYLLLMIPSYGYINNVI